MPGGTTPGTAVPGPNPVALENARPGTAAWDTCRCRCGPTAVNVAFRPPTDPRIDGVLILRHAGAAAFATNDPGVVRVCTSTTRACVDRIRANRRRIVRYAAVAVDRWGQSAPLLSVPIRLVPGRSRSG